MDRLKWGPVLVWVALLCVPVVGLGASSAVFSPMQDGNLQEVKAALASLPIDESPAASAGEIQYLKSVYVLDRKFEDKLKSPSECVRLTRYQAEDPAENRVHAVRDYSKQDLLETEALMGSKDYDARFALLLRELKLDPKKYASIADLEGLLKEFSKSPQGRKLNIDHSPLPQVLPRLSNFLAKHLGASALSPEFKDVLAYNLVARRLAKEPSQWRKHLRSANEVCSSSSKLDLLQAMGRRFAHAKNSTPHDWTKQQLHAAQSLGFQAVAAKPPEADDALRFRDPKNPQYIFEMSLPINMARGGSGFKGSPKLKEVEPKRMQFETGDGTTVILKAGPGTKPGEMTAVALETAQSAARASQEGKAPPDTQIVMMAGSSYAEITKTTEGVTTLNSPTSDVSPKDMNKVEFAKGTDDLSPSTISPSETAKEQALELPQKVEQEFKATGAGTSTNIKLKAETKQELTAVDEAIRRHEEVAQTNGEVKIGGFVLGVHGHFTNTYKSDGTNLVQKNFSGTGRYKLSDKESIALTQEYKIPDENTHESRQRLEIVSVAPGGIATIGGERSNTTRYDNRRDKIVYDSTDYSGYVDYENDNGFGGRLTLGMGYSDDKSSGVKESRTRVAFEGRIRSENYTTSAEVGLEEVRSTGDGDTTRLHAGVKVESRKPGNFVRGSITHDSKSRTHSVEVEGHIAEGRLEGGLKLAAVIAPNSKIQKSGEVALNIRPEDPDDRSYWRIRAIGNPQEGSRGIVSFVIPLGPSASQ